MDGMGGCSKESGRGCWKERKWMKEEGEKKEMDI